MKPTLVYRPGKGLVAAAPTKDAKKAPVGKAAGKPTKIAVVFKGGTVPVTFRGKDQYGEPKSESLVVSKKSAKAMGIVPPPSEDPAAELARRRALKAAQMRRYRAKKEK